MEGRLWSSLASGETWLILEGRLWSSLTGVPSGASGSPLTSTHASPKTEASLFVPSGVVPSLRLSWVFARRDTERCMCSTGPLITLTMSIELDSFFCNASSSEPKHQHMVPATRIATDPTQTLAITIIIILSSSSVVPELGMKTASVVVRVDLSVSVWKVCVTSVVLVGVTVANVVVPTIQVIDVRVVVVVLVGTVRLVHVSVVKDVSVRVVECGDVLVKVVVCAVVLVRVVVKEVAVGSGVSTVLVTTSMV